MSNTANKKSAKKNEINAAKMAETQSRLIHTYLELYNEQKQAEQALNAVKAEIRKYAEVTGIASFENETAMISIYDIAGKTTLDKDMVRSLLGNTAYDACLKVGEPSQGIRATVKKSAV